MKKQIFAFCGAAALSCALVVGIAALNSNGKHLEPTFSGVNPYELSVSSYADVNSGAKTGNGNTITFAKSGLSDTGGVGTLANGGYIYNTTKISGIGRISVTLASGSIKIYYGRNSYASWDDYVVGPNADFESIRPNYFKIEATSATVITSFVVQYDCHDYQGDLANIPYRMEVNGVPAAGTFVDATKQGEGYDKQYKINVDLYRGDVLAFWKDEALLSPSVTAVDNNNAYMANGRIMVDNTKLSADLYFKVTGGNYEVWISGKGDPFSESPLQSEGTILQAWNWSIATIKSNLQNIANAGYRSVQVSPLQVRKEISSNNGWRQEWWKFYQPYSLSINGYEDNVLGNRAALVDLCASAKEFGIDIIMDVVVNHLSGGSWNTFNGQVQYFESEIYSQGLKHNLGKMGNGQGELGYGQQALIQGAMGEYPDLQTENAFVQDRALSLLEDYLDCGVAGFRFDAAKHIETPYDGSYASSFWPHVVNGAKRYAAKNGYPVPYCYGEILAAGDGGRSINWYAPYMSVTEATNDYDLRDAVNGAGTGKVLAACNYYAGLSAGAKQYVLWAETHDSFQAGHTSYLSEEQINKVYAIQASRAYANALYMARPGESTNIGSVGLNWWKGSVPTAVNKLHSRFAAGTEYLSVNDGTFVNVRTANGETGAVVVNINHDGASYGVSLPGMYNGTYVDLITHNEYTVTDGYVSNLGFTDGVCVLSPKTGLPSYYLVGNQTFVGEGTPWSISSGIKLTRSGDNIAEIHDHHFDEGAEVKILKQQEGVDDVWYDVTLGQAYDYCSKVGTNLRFDKSGTYSIFLNSSAVYYVTGTPDEQGGGQSSSEASSSAQSSATPSSSSSQSSQAQQSYTVTFAVTRDVGNGNAVYMLGDFTSPTWTLSASPRGEWTTGNVWKVSLTKPAGTTIAFKFVCATYNNPSGITYWESDPNHTYPFTSNAEVTVNWQ